jgi:hypothetical protein
MTLLKPGMTAQFELPDGSVYEVEVPKVGAVKEDEQPPPVKPA